MSASYTVVTFASANDGALARIRVPLKTAKDVTTLDWLPVVIHAPTEAAARDKADAFYQSELERFAKQEASRVAGREKAAATRKTRAEVSA